MTQSAMSAKAIHCQSGVCLNDIRCAPLGGVRRLNIRGQGRHVGIVVLVDSSFQLGCFVDQGCRYGPVRSRPGDLEKRRSMTRQIVPIDHDISPR
jgi:hypothetical protein